MHKTISGLYFGTVPGKVYFASTTNPGDNDWVEAKVVPPCGGESMLMVPPLLAQMLDLAGNYGGYSASAAATPSSRPRNVSITS